jgi:hypothetical protein
MIGLRLYGQLRLVVCSCTCLSAAVRQAAANPSASRCALAGAAPCWWASAAAARPPSRASLRLSPASTSAAPMCAEATGWPPSGRTSSAPARWGRGKVLSRCTISSPRPPGCKRFAWAWVDGTVCSMARISARLQTCAPPPLQAAGVEGRPTAFLLPDSALAGPEAGAILADVSALLSTGDVAGAAWGASAPPRLAAVVTRCHPRVPS